MLKVRQVYQATKGRVRCPHYCCNTSHEQGQESQLQYQIKSRPSSSSSSSSKDETAGAGTESHKAAYKLSAGLGTGTGSSKKKLQQNKPASLTSPATIIPTNINNIHLRKSLQLQTEQPKQTFSSDTTSRWPSSTIEAINSGNTPVQLHYPHEEFVDKDLSVQEQLKRAYDDAYQYCSCKSIILQCTNIVNPKLFFSA